MPDLEMSNPQMSNPQMSNPQMSNPDGATRTRADRSPSTATAASFRGPRPATTAWSPSSWARARRRRRHRRRRGPGHADARARRSRPDAALQRRERLSERVPALRLRCGSGGAGAMRRHLLVTNDFPPKVGGIQSYLWELWRRVDPDSFVVLTASSHPDAPAFDAAQGARRDPHRPGPRADPFFPTPGAFAEVRRCVHEHDIGLVLFDPALPLGLLGPRIGRALRGHPPRSRGHRAGPDSRRRARC